MNKVFLARAALALLALVGVGARALAADDGVSIVIHDQEGATSTEEGVASDSAFWIEDEESDEADSGPSVRGHIAAGGIFGEQTGWFAGGMIDWGTVYLHLSGGQTEDVELAGVGLDDNEFDFYSATAGWHLPWFSGISLEVGPVGAQLTDSLETPWIEAFGWKYGLAYTWESDTGAMIHLAGYGYDVEGSYLGTLTDNQGLTFSVWGMLPLAESWSAWVSFESGMEIEAGAATALGVPLSWRIGTDYMFTDMFGVGIAYGQTDWDAALLPDSQTSEFAAYINIALG
ncbi:hypothetical protein IIA16_04960 [bacterium]|nr:hypothetical protein [bacterium]